MWNVIWTEIVIDTLGKFSTTHPIRFTRKHDGNSSDFVWLLFTHAGYAARKTQKSIYFSVISRKSESSGVFFFFNPNKKSVTYARKTQFSLCCINVFLNLLFLLSFSFSVNFKTHQKWRNGKFGGTNHVGPATINKWAQRTNCLITRNF